MIIDSYHNHHESLICFLTSSKNGSSMGLGNYANFQTNKLPSIYNNISALHSGCSQEQPLFDFKTRERRKRYVTGSNDGNVRAGRSGTCV